MNIIQYQEEARKTAIYPKESFILYPALGLAGECGELCEKLIQDASIHEIQKEISDVLWYCANLALDCDLLLNQVAGIDLFDEVVPHFDLNVPGMLASRIGTICEVVKKLIRDDNGELTHEKQQLIKDGIHHVLRTLAEICVPYEFSLEDCAILNIEKLKSRQERGVLQGSGDNR